jgi:hypothetical protein
MSAFFGVIATVDFALLGLWWVAVQARPDLRRHAASGDRLAYVVSLQFIVPGTAALLAMVDPAVTTIWRVSFGIAGATGIAAIVSLVPALAAAGAGTVARFLRFGALPLYALMGLFAVAPGLLSGSSAQPGALNVEGLLFCLVVFLAVQVAWAAAMSTGPADDQQPPDPGRHADRQVAAFSQPRPSASRRWPPNGPMEPRSR